MSSSRKSLSLITVLAVVVLAATTVLLPDSAVTSRATRSRLQSWIAGGWQSWNAAEWQKGQGGFYNPTIKGLWDAQRMSSSPAADAVPPNPAVQEGVSDPAPSPVSAQSAPTPYHLSSAVLGRIFFDSPEGPRVCSGTAVRDPARPGRSNLVWTAGHCVHAGAGRGWFRNVVFIPSYNDSGLSKDARRSAPLNEVAPFGIWWADKAAASPQWRTQGSETGGGGAPFDFAVLQVRPPANASSLEESLGDAVSVRFDILAADSLAKATAWGYPAETPFDGEKLYACQDRPTRYSPVRDQPTMYRIGCTMNAGASGGGWFAQEPDGSPVLVSNTSIGPADSTWLAGPHLGLQAKRTLEAMSEMSGAG